MQKHYNMHIYILTQLFYRYKELVIEYSLDVARIRKYMNLKT